MDWPSLLLASFAVLFIGVAKAGFGGGLGMLVTPLCVLAFGSKTAIGILLPFNVRRERNFELRTLNR